MCEMTAATIDASSTDVTCSCNVIQTFHGGRTQTVLSKSLLVCHPSDNSRLIVCAGQEASSSVSYLALLENYCF